MAATDSFYRAAERRIEWLTLVLGLSAAAFAAARWGWPWGAGVLCGAGLTWINFQWLKQGVDTLVEVSTTDEGAEQAHVPKRVYVKSFSRFALLLIVVYVILSRSWLPVAAVLAGLFVVIGAVLAELIFELARGGRESETHT
jgi:hypothetical protein